jgi:hypothetical protein
VVHVPTKYTHTLRQMWERNHMHNRVLEHGCVVSDNFANMIILAVSQSPSLDDGYHAFHLLLCTPKRHKA